MSSSDVTVSNINYGHGHLYVAGASVGAISGGLFVSKATTTFDINIDQLTTPVRTIPIKEEFSVKTNIAEITLANLKVIWNQPASNLTGTTILNVGVSTGVSIVLSTRSVFGGCRVN